MKELAVAGAMSAVCRWLEDEIFARLPLKNPPDAPCSVEADEPEQLDLFSELDGGEE